MFYDRRSKFGSMENKYFTYALTTGERSSGRPTLVFENGENDFKIEEVVKDPKFKEVFGDLPVLAFTTHYGNLIVTPKLPIEAFDWLDRAQKDENIWSIGSDGKIDHVNMHECYYSCLRPQKLIVGCVECAKTEEEGPADCRLKQLLHFDPSYPEPNYLSPSDMLRQFKSRKTTLAGYTFVGPRLTADEAFPETFRNPGRHDFSYVDENSERIRKALQERKRIDQFETNECPGCLVKEHCGRSNAKYCQGPHAVTQREAEREIIKHLDTPYTRRELTFLMNHTGELGKRYGRCKYYAVLENDGGTLLWGLRRKTRPYKSVINFKEFKEAKEVIEKYKVPNNDYGKITPTLLASWIEMSGRQCSPCNRGRWHRTTYPRAYLQRCGGGLTAYFSWSSRGMLLPWNQEITKPQDVYKYYGYFNTLTKDSSPFKR